MSNMSGDVSTLDELSFQIAKILNRDVVDKDSVLGEARKLG